MGSETTGIVVAMLKVMDEVGAIGKGRTNPQQGYKFRGIDDVVAELQPLMAKHGILMSPKVLEREREVLATKSGGSMASVRLLVEHTFRVADGSSVVATTLGEAMDSGDKASNKAMSAALKYALTETFMIPVRESERDTEEHSPQLAPKVLTEQLKASLAAQQTRPVFIAGGLVNGVVSRPIANPAKAVVDAAKVRRMPIVDVPAKTAEEQAEEDYKASILQSEEPPEVPADIRQYPAGPPPQGNGAPAARPPVTAGPTVFPGFGRSKGKPIAGADPETLSFYANAARRSLADPAKAKFHAKEKALLEAIEAEVARQYAAEQGEP